MRGRVAILAGLLAIPAWSLAGAAGTAGAAAQEAGPGPPPNARPVAPVTVRAADHDGFGRIVLDLPPQAGVTRAQDGGVLSLRLSGAAAFGPVPRAVRNAASVRAEGQVLRIEVRPGVIVKGGPMGNRYVVDLRDAPPAVPAATVGAGPAVDSAASPAKQEAAQTAGAKRPEPRKAAPQKAEPQKAEPQKAEPQKAEPQTGEPQKGSSQAGGAGSIKGETVAKDGSVRDVRKRPSTIAAAAASTPASHPAPATPAPATPVAASPVAASPGPAALTAGAVAPATPLAPVLPVTIAAIDPRTIGAPVPGASAGSADAAPGAETDVDADPVPAPAAAPDTATRARLVVPKGGATLAFAIPAGQAVGAAAFRRGDEVLVVLDGRRTLDLSALSQTPALAAARAESLSDATLLHLPVAADVNVRLSRGTWRTRRGKDGNDSWIVAFGPSLVPSHSMVPASADGRITLPTAWASQVVTVPDPLSGGLLLVGTERAEPHAEGSAVPSTRRGPSFALLSTFQGAAVDAMADDLALQVTKAGFVLSDAHAPVSLADASADANAQSLTRTFDFPKLPAPDLLRRLRTDIGDAASAGALARAPMRLAVARSMLALGFGAEAQALVLLAQQDDPRIRNRPETLALAASAALLAGRVEEASGLDDPRLPQTDELQFWRATRDVLHGPEAAMARLRAAPDETAAGDAGAAAAHDADPDAPPPGAVAAMVATAPVLLLYPKPLQARLGPVAVQTLAAGNEGKRAQRLLDSLVRSGVDEGALTLARAMTAEALGDADTALTLYRTIQRGRDTLARSRATRRATELRLRLGQISPEAAATELEHAFLAWRDDARELSLRLRAADLRRGTDGAAALKLLREAWQVFPQAKLRPRLQAVLADAVMGPSAERLPPIELVSLVDGNVDLLPPEELDASLTDRLARKLAALDLPARALPLLERLTRSAPSEPAKLRFAIRAAELLLADRDASQALRVLQAVPDPASFLAASSLAASSLAASPTSAAADAADPDAAALPLRRKLLLARARAMTGDAEGALAALTDVPGRDAALQRAGLLEARQDFAAAAQNLRDALAPVLPGDAPLDKDDGALVLRLASALARAGDEEGLAALHDAAGSRLPPGPDADMLRVLTAPPVRTVADIGRAAKETANARAVLAAATK